MPIAIDDILSKMTLEERAGQVMMIGFDGTSCSPELHRIILDLHIGGVIEFARNVDSPRAVAQLAADLQHTARASGLPGLFISIDQEGGRVTRLKADHGFTEFPSARVLGSTRDPEKARSVARLVAEEMKAVGINMDLAPVLDVDNNPANPIIGNRSFGADPESVARFGVAFLEGLQSEGILAVGKHFPGHGDTDVDSHIGLPVVRHDLARLHAVEFVPFRAAIAAGVAGIMSAHIAFPAIDASGIAATLSAPVMTGLLQQVFHFEGLRITDSLEMGALATSGYPAPLAAAMALAAGADVLLFNRDHDLHREAHRTIVDWIRRGKIPKERLDDAVRRILAAKARFGILNPEVPDIASAGARVGTAARKEIVDEISRVA